MAGKPMTCADELLIRLQNLLPSQFEEVLLRAGIPLRHIRGANAAQTERAVDVVRYAEQQNQLEPLARIIGDVERVGPVFALVQQQVSRSIVLASAIDQRSFDGLDSPLFKNPDIPAGTEFLASVVFVHIGRLKDCSDGPRIPRALRALSEALREVDSSAFVLTALTGAIIVIPDGASWSVDATLAALERAAVGFALRVGVSHGMVNAVTDIDGQLNLVGPPINTAARLASSLHNTGALVDESYAQFVEPILAGTHWLHPSQRTPRTIIGKPQDPLFTCFAAPYRFDVVDAQPAPSPEPTWRPAVLIAYDLPGFSAGDRDQLRKRFTLLGNVFQRLRQGNPSAQASMLLSPGGDGGVLVLDGVKPAQAANIAFELHKLTEIESRDHDDPIAVRLRIGVHYGHVTSYRNARGLTRPTGRDVFVADEIASDEHARKAPGVILTKKVADSVAGGSAAFQPLPACPQGPAFNVERYRTPPAWDDPPSAEEDLGRRFRFTSFGSLIGLVLGALIGLWRGAYPFNMWLWDHRYWFPFIIQILLAPLLIAAVIRGVASRTVNQISLKDSLKTIGWFISKMLVWFALSMVAALVIGLAIARVAPDAAVSCPPDTPKQEQGKGATTGSVASSTPPDPRDGSTEAHIGNYLNYLPMIFFVSAVFGFFLPSAGPKGKPIKQVIESLETVFSKMAGFFVPFVVPFVGAAALAAQIGRYGPVERWSMIGYILLLCGALVVYLVFLLVAMKVLTRVRWRTFLPALFQPAVIASVTRTSGAAMPFTMSALVRLGIPPDIVGFVVPAGGLFNLAGSTLYVMFGMMIAKRCGGVSLGTMNTMELFCVIVTVMAKSVTIAGVPGGALDVIGRENPSMRDWLAPCDFFMDMCRTCVNVIGNSVATVIVASWERKILPEAKIYSSSDHPELSTTRRHR